MKILLDIISLWVSFEGVLRSMARGGEVERGNYGEN
jgi:hypothetical protein